MTGREEFVGKDLLVLRGGAAMARPIREYACGEAAAAAGPIG